MANAIRVAHSTVFLGEREILHDLNCTIHRGDRCFILGANGAGKTTFVKMLMGYAWPVYGGEVEVLGHRFGTVNLIELRKKIALVSPFLQQWTDGETKGIELVLSGLDGNLGLFRKVTTEERELALGVMERLHCEHLANQSMYSMSSGEQVKILIARALMSNPEMVVLDEPSVYLDIAGREFLLNAICEMARSRPELTMVFITQRIEDIMPEFSTGMILKSGRIFVEGSRREVLTEKNLCESFGVNIRLLEGRNGRLWSVVE
ncbi:MAG: ATP-binding cassette domain-containing protein [Victivallaceae bacterium]|nr:ATP-binding cassette domain-containing protein [Victivallaceae bacterium]